MGARLAAREVMRALDTLPEEQRSVVTLVCVEDLSYREVSEIPPFPRNRDEPAVTGASRSRRGSGGRYDRGRHAHRGSGMTTMDPSNGITDEMLVAFADGEADLATIERIEAALETDEALAERLEASSQRGKS